MLAVLMRAVLMLALLMLALLMLAVLMWALLMWAMLEVAVLMRALVLLAVLLLALLVSFVLGLSLRVVGVVAVLVLVYVGQVSGCLAELTTEHGDDRSDNFRGSGYDRTASRCVRRTSRVDDHSPGGTNKRDTGSHVPELRLRGDHSAEPARCTQRQLGRGRAQKTVPPDRFADPVQHRINVINTEPVIGDD
jgi:hypothetical protein